MTTPLGALSRTFSRAASHYHELGIPQRAIAERLVQLANTDAVSGPILELGCGTGSLTILLRKAFPQELLVISDLSREMVREARAHESATTPLVGSFDQLPFLPGTFGLVASNAALHWGGSLLRSLQEAASLLARDGRLLVSVMILGSCRELHDARAVAVPSLAPHRRLPTTDECLATCQRVGFSIEEAAEVEEVEYFPSAWTAIQSLHLAGLTGGDLSQGRRLLQRRELERLCLEYETSARNARGVPITYKALLLRACKRL